MTLLTPPAALSEATFGRPEPFGRDFGPPDTLKASILTSFWRLFHTFLGLTARMAPRPAPGAQNQLKMCRKTISKGSETDPK